MAVTDPITSGWIVLCACGWAVFRRSLKEANNASELHLAVGAEGVDHVITYQAKGDPIR